jgi:hypothetical protein
VVNHQKSAQLYENVKTHRSAGLSVQVLVTSPPNFPKTPLRSWRCHGPSREELRRFLEQTRHCDVHSDTIVRPSCENHGASQPSRRRHLSDGHQNHSHEPFRQLCPLCEMSATSLILLLSVECHSVRAGMSRSALQRWRGNKHLRQPSKTHKHINRKSIVLETE